MKKYHLPFWKDAPFTRIILPFIAGITISYYTGIDEKIYLVIIVGVLAVLTCYSRLKLELKFRFRYVNGILINLFITATGAYLAGIKNPFQKIKLPQQGSMNEMVYVISLVEPLSEKKSSWKALCRIEYIQNKNKIIYPGTNILLYIKKDSSLNHPEYGSRIAFKKQPERIKNFVTGSSFDYQRYCALKNIHYQIFLKPSDFIFLEGKNSDPVNKFLFKMQQWVIAVLKKNIRGDKECGLAEALLIGYKNDLDKNLIQSYSNTGVVHVVAISGLHLGLIYTILNMICRPFKRKFLRPIIILTGLWMFSLLAGGSPSVLRSAIMFSTMVIGETVSRKSSVLNNLAVSAFFLLCYDPYWLWDLGFILSYGALLSIVMFMKPVYEIYISENKIIDHIWKLNAVTISAQVLTLPVLIYYFNQFPNLFIITNFLAIPLSGIILTGEIVLCAVYFIEPIAMLCGKLLTLTIRLMNEIVEYIDGLPFSSTRNIHINFMQVVLLYVFIGFAASWLMNKHKSWQ
jgi:competence protein ComEC